MTDAFLAQTTQNEEHFQLVKSLGFRSYISVPLRSRDQTLGSVTLVSVTRSFGPDDVAFAEQLAEHVAAVVHKTRGFDIATRTSHILQSTLLPARLPDVPGLDVHTRYVAASEGLEVGGDFYDIVSVGRGRVAFMIGDVAGHDRIAAALMGQLRSAVRTLVDRVRSPSEMVEALQHSWDRLDFDRMATGVFGLLDAASGDMALVSAGHYPPVRFGRGQASYVPIDPSPPLGVPGPVHDEWRGRLEPGEGLLFYTDGFIDERTLGAERSMEQLLATVDGSDSDDLESLCDSVVGLLASERSDDAALMALRFQP
jgi:serine/threonine-protein kinase RsbW